MELRHLKYFVTLAEELHFGRAAERLHISQPPLSQQIKALERELGARLLTRTSRHVELTQSGRIFLAEAKATLVQAERAQSIAGRAERGEVGELRIGLFASAPLSLLVSTALTTFRHTFPEVSLVLRERATPQQIDDLQGERLDLGFLRSHTPPNLPSALEASEIVREKLFVFLPAQHPLATTNAPLKIEALADEAFVFFAREVRSTLHDQVYALCAASGFTPHVSQEANTNSMIVGLVAAGMGVSVLPAAQARVRSEGIRVRPLAGSESHTATWLARRRHQRDAKSDWFIHHFQNIGPQEERTPS